MARYIGVGKFERWLDRKCNRLDKEFDKVMKTNDDDFFCCDNHSAHQEYVRAEQATATEIWNKFQELTKKK